MMNNTGITSSVHPATIHCYVTLLRYPAAIHCYVTLLRFTAARHSNYLGYAPTNARYVFATDTIQ